MRSYLWPCAVVLLLLASTAAFAGDTVFMPTGNQVAKGDFEYNFIYVDLDPPSAVPASTRGRGGPPKFLMIHELFIGVTDRLEVDVDILDPENSDEAEEINVYYTVFKETDDHPSLILGAYNLLRSDFPIRPGNDKRTSPFFVSSYNLLKPAAAPSFSDPLVRGHLGWGTGQHDSDFFGGVQCLVDPKIGAAVYTHRGDMAYIGVYRPRKCLEFRGGTLGGDGWGSFGLYGTF
ncbi:MAG: hypothetical protein PVH68_01305 [Armatimonadota bacterium]|jgi:hypothetical protein